LTKISFTLVLLFGLSCTTQRPKIDRDVASAYPSQPASDLKDPTFDDLTRILKQQPKISKIEDLLKVLNSRYPSYFERFTLAYRSHSLHGASYVNPRALVFGRTGKLILTFNGAPDQDAYDKLEVMRFDDQSHKFEFREIAFKESNTQIPWNHRILPPDQISSRPEIRCSSCHGPNPRPIWEPYFTWPGFYGADDDSSYIRFAKESANIPKEMFISDTLVRMYGGSDGRPSEKFNNNKEYQHLVTFFRQQKTHLRYQYLIDGFFRRINQAKGSTNGNGLSYLNPNTQLTIRLSKLNGLRIAKEINSDPSLRKMAARYLFLNSNCKEDLLGDAQAAIPLKPEGIRDEVIQGVTDNMILVAKDFGYESQEFNATQVADNTMAKPFFVWPLYEWVRRQSGADKVAYWPMSFQRFPSFQDGEFSYHIHGPLSVSLAREIFRLSRVHGFDVNSLSDGVDYDESVNGAQITERGCKYLAQLLNP